MIWLILCKKQVILVARGRITQSFICCRSFRAFFHSSYRFVCKKGHHHLCFHSMLQLVKFVSSQTAHKRLHCNLLAFFLCFIMQYGVLSVNVQFLAGQFLTVFTLLQLIFIYIIYLFDLVLKTVEVPWLSLVFKTSLQLQLLEFLVKLSSQFQHISLITTAGGINLVDTLSFSSTFDAPNNTTLCTEQ